MRKIGRTIVLFNCAVFFSGYSSNQNQGSVLFCAGSQHWQNEGSRETGPPKQAPVDLRNYTPAFTDEFKSGFLDSRSWDYLEENTTRGYGKMLRSNVVVSGGTLKLYARKTVNADGQTSFSASMVSTQHSLNQKYGYFEIRARVNKQVGPHAAFWLQQHSVGTVNKVPNPSIFGTEIDIFEYHRGAGTENLYFGLHWNGYNFTDGSHRTITSSARVPGIDTGFHTFALEWTPKKYIVFIDGVQKAQTDQAISHIPEFLILSTEITGYGGDRFQMSAEWPDVFEVDYVRVYARKPAITIYGDCDGYGWVSDELRPGKYTSEQLAVMGIINNQASSVEIPEGWNMKIFDGNNFTGASTIIKKSQRCIENFNDRLSSLIIAGPAKNKN